MLVQPAGQSDRVLTRPGTPSRILPGGADPELGPARRLVAVDLDGRERRGGASASATRRATAWPRRCSPRVGAELRDAGDADDLARLVPEYVTLPRGVLSQPPADGGVAISDDARRATGRIRA